MEQFGTAKSSFTGALERACVLLVDSAHGAQAIVDPREAAELAGLRYVSDARPGIRRKKAGKGFTYTRADGSKLSEPDLLKRIKALAIPPAWTDVWICPFADGHVQATGRDAKGRKQYRYHVRFRDLAAMALRELQSFDSAAQAKRNLRGAIEKVAARLGNTPTICRKCYVHPEVLDAYLNGNLLLELKTKAENELRRSVEDLKPEEAAVLALLRTRLADKAEQLIDSSGRSSAVSSAPRLLNRFDCA
jgi:DNA topoisomerase IB